MSKNDIKKCDRCGDLERTGILGGGLIQISVPTSILPSILDLGSRFLLCINCFDNLITKIQ